MRFKVFLFYIFFSLSSLMYASEESLDQEIANSKNIDDLIEKMNQVSHQYRYKYMNAIKQQLSSLKETDRKNKIDEVLVKIKSSSKDRDSTGYGKSGNGNSNSHGSDNSGGNGNGGSGGGSNGNGGGSGNGGGGKH